MSAILTILYRVVLDNLCYVAGHPAERIDHKRHRNNNNQRWFLEDRNGRPLTFNDLQSDVLLVAPRMPPQYFRSSDEARRACSRCAACSLHQV